MGKSKMSSETQGLLLNVGVNVVFGLAGLGISLWSARDQKKHGNERAYLMGKGMGDSLAAHAEENNWPERIGTSAGSTIANDIKRVAMLDEKGNLVLK